MLVCWLEGRGAGKGLMEKGTFASRFDEFGEADTENIGWGFGMLGHSVGLLWTCQYVDDLDGEDGEVKEEQI